MILEGVVTTVSDPEGRPTVMKFFARAGARVFPVGRLDYQSEGLLLMTNDGELANVLTSAASKVEKTYLVKVSGKPTEAELEQLRRGVMIERGRHPRFTIGEATTPDTNFRLKLLSVRYGIPEIMHLSAFHELRDSVSPASRIEART